MSWKDLGIPRPRRKPRVYCPIQWPVRDSRLLLQPSIELAADFFSVVMARRTRREFGPVSLPHLSNLLWFCARQQATAESPFGFPLELRPTLSAGALHPIHVLLSFDPAGDWLRYNPDHHCLDALAIDSELSHALWREAETVLPVEQGILLLYIAEPDKVEAKYSASQSLVWRDAGALLGHTALVAEALALNFCPLGITGEPWVGRLAEQGQLVGVGMAVVGTRF